MAENRRRIFRRQCSPYLRNCLIHRRTCHKLQPSSGWMNVVALRCESDCGQFVAPSSLSGSCLFRFHCHLYTVHSALLILLALVRLSSCPRIITLAAAAIKAGELLQDLTSPGLYFIARCLIHVKKKNSPPPHP